MKTADVDRLFLEYVDTGSPLALARVFDAVAGELLLLAGHLTADAHAAEDLVQTTFLEAMRSKRNFNRTGSVKSWLVGILSNQARMDWRRLRRKLDPDRLRVEHAVCPDVEVEVREFAAALHEAMEAMPPKYREVMRLGLFHGLPVKEIAQAVDRPRQTVKTQFRRGLELLRGALPSSLALGAMVMLTPGRGLAAIREHVMTQAELLLAGAGSGPVTGASASSSSATKLVALAAVVVALVTVGLTIWIVMNPDSESRASSVRGDHARHETMDSNDAAVRRSALADQEDAPEPVSGRLIVRAMFASTGERAAHVLVGVVPAGDVSWLRELRATTDATGVATFDDLPIGRVRIRGDRGGEIEADVRGDVKSDLSIPAGVHVYGAVVDRSGEPVRDAAVWIIPPRRGMDEGFEAARSDANGEFHLRDVEPGRAVIAFDEFRVPAIPVPIEGKPGDRCDQRVQFRGPGSGVHGIVRGPDGRPIAGAAVVVGWIIELSDGAVMPAYRLRTDAVGAFRSPGLPSAIPAPTWVRAENTATFHRMVASAGKGSSAFVSVELTAGAAVSGRVSGSAEESRAGVLVEAHADGSRVESSHGYSGPQWARSFARSGVDGGFELTGVIPGRGELVASAREIGEVTDRYELATGQSATWNPKLVACEETVSGRLLDARGRSLSGLSVRLVWSGSSAVHAASSTDGDGRFGFPGRENSTFTLYVTDPKSVASGLPFVITGEPMRSPKDWVVPDAHLATCTVRGRLLEPDGQHAKAGHLTLVREDRARMNVFLAKFTVDGTEFRAGPVPPGDYHLYLRGERTGFGIYLGRFEIQPGQTVDVGTARTSKPGSLSLKVLDPDGEPTGMAQINLETPNGPLAAPVTLVGGRGVLESLQPGTWHLQTWAKTHVPAYRDVVIRPGEKNESVLQLERGLQVELRYEGRLAGGGTCIFRLYECGSDRDKLIYKGVQVLSPRFVKETIAMRPGRYRLELRYPDGKSARTEFTIRADVANVVVVRFP